MTQQHPNDFRKKATSLALYLQETRSHLLQMMAYLEQLKRKMLFYELARSTGLSSAKAQEILLEMKEWIPGMRIRTERIYLDFEKEWKEVEQFSSELLKQPLEQMRFLFSQLRESKSEESLAHLQDSIVILQNEPLSKEKIRLAKEALENIHHLYTRLLDAVHTEEKDLLEEEATLTQIKGNIFLEQQRDNILETLKELFRKRYLIQQHLDIKYEPFPEADISVRLGRESVDRQTRVIVSATITVAGKVGQPSWEARLRYDADRRRFEAAFGIRKWFQWVPEEQKRYTSREQVLRDFPAQFIQYVLNSILMRRT